MVPTVPSSPVNGANQLDLMLPRTGTTLARAANSQGEISHSMTAVATQRSSTPSNSGGPWINVVPSANLKRAVPQASGVSLFRLVMSEYPQPTHQRHSL